MLKPLQNEDSEVKALQPPSGGCVLKQRHLRLLQIYFWQPPSGGCVLKRFCDLVALSHKFAAAFGRLCVETVQVSRQRGKYGGSRLRAAVC